MKKSCLLALLSTGFLSSCTVQGFVTSSPSKIEESSRPGPSINSTSGANDSNPFQSEINPNHIESMCLLEGYKKIYYQGEKMQYSSRVLIKTLKGEEIIYHVSVSDVREFSTARLGMSEVRLCVFSLPINYFITVIENTVIDIKLEKKEFLLGSDPGDCQALIYFHDGSLKKVKINKTYYEIDTKIAGDHQGFINYQNFSKEISYVVIIEPVKA